MVSILQPDQKIAFPDSDVDFVVVGEPENTVFELINALELGKQDFKEIDGLGFRKNGKAVLTGKRAMIEDLDSLAVSS